MTAVLANVLRQSWAGLRILLAFTVVLGLAYPLVVFGIAQVLLNDQANGTLVERNGQVVGSSLIGQTFEGPQWFHSRPSAAGDGYDPMATAGSNLGPESDELLALVEERRLAVAEEDGVDAAAVPPDALTASASGLDPHISPAYAHQQVARVAAERGLAPDVVEALVDEHVQGRVLGFLGAERVNVLELNLALAQR